MKDMETADRPKLGLALAGGGFRASLFHLGVLRRLQEMQALRYVEVLSTVSGGSIIGALYVLHLKNAIDQHGPLTDDDYKGILDTVEQTIINGIQKNLRNRLFMNPFGWLKMFILGESLSKRMARLYERYLYRRVVRDILTCRTTALSKLGNIITKAKRWLFPGRLSLRDLRYYPPQTDLATIGFGNYVIAQIGSDQCTVPVQLILNATSLNSGNPFFFSSVEIGDPRLGFIRGADMNEVSDCRELLEKGVEELEQILKAQSPNLNVTIGKTAFNRRRIALALWWLRRKTDDSIPKEWKGLFSALKDTKVPEALLDISFGHWRQMKLAVWYVLIGYQNKPNPYTGGLTKQQWLDRFWNNMRREQRELEAKLRPIASANEQLRDDLLEFVMWTYYFRSTEIIARDIHDDWKKITIGDAVGASACFPPVFSPYEFLGIYDDTHVSRLGLTDGGVYDNAGIAALLDANCTHIIASDTGGMFDIEQRASKGRAGMMGRIASILMDEVAEQQRNNLRERHIVTNIIQNVQKPPKEIEDLKHEYKLHGLVYFHINSPPVGETKLGPAADPDLLAELRTDLDGFGDVEVNALVNQGYDMADRYMRRFFKQEAGQFKLIKLDAATKLPRPLNGWEKEQIDGVLRAGKHRLFRSLSLNVKISWAFTLFLAAAVIYTTWGIEVSVGELIDKGMDQIMIWLESSMPFFGAGWTRRLMPLGLFLLILALLIVGIIKLKPVLEQWLEARIPKAFRIYLKVAKFARRARGNVLWLVGYLPALVAIALSIVFAISYIFYYLPYKSHTRVEK